MAQLIDGGLLLLLPSSAGSPPAADFTGTPTSGSVPLSVQFTDASTGSPTSWNWDFGNGNVSTQQNPSNVYSASGTYTVTLFAHNANGTGNKVIAGYITVVAAIPSSREISGGGAQGVRTLLRASARERRRRQQRDERDVIIVLRAVLPHIERQVSSELRIELENEDEQLDS